MDLFTIGLNIMTALFIGGSLLGIILGGAALGYILTTKYL